MKVEVGMYPCVKKLFLTDNPLEGVGDCAQNGQGKVLLRSCHDTCGGANAKKEKWVEGEGGGEEEDGCTCICVCSFGNTSCEQSELQPMDRHGIQRLLNMLLAYCQDAWWECEELYMGRGGGVGEEAGRHVDPFFLALHHAVG